MDYGCGLGAGTNAISVAGVGGDCLHYCADVIYFAQQVATDRLTKRSLKIYREAFFEKIERGDVRSLMKKERGEYLAMLTSQLTTLENDYFWTMYYSFFLLCQLLVACVLAFWKNPLLAFFVIILALPNVIVPNLFHKVIKGRRQHVIRATQTLVNKTEDLLTGLVTWKTANKAKAARTYYNTASEQLFTEEKSEIHARMVVQAISQYFANFLYYGTWLLGVYFVLNKDFSLGALVAFTALSANISEPLSSSAEMITYYIAGKEVADEMMRLIEEPEEQVESRQEPIKQIEIKNLSVTIDGRAILWPTSATFTAGKKYLLMGDSGSGKSTLIRTLMRERDEYEGTITINGYPLSDWSPQELYEQIGYLSQDVHIFKASLLDNLTLFESQENLEDIHAVLRYVGLEKWANEESLNMQIGSGEGAQRVSGGEAKRIGLARLLLQGKQILFLDEFSAGLDHVLLQRIEEQLLESPCLIIYITHVYDEHLMDGIDGVVRLGDSL